MNRSEQLTTARALGAEFFRKGGRCIPAADRRVLALIDGRAVGVTPNGEAPTAHILKAWTDGWTGANLAAVA